MITTTPDIHQDCGRVFRGEITARDDHYRAVCQLLWEAYHLVTNDQRNVVDRRDWEQEAGKVLFHGD